MMTAAAQRDAKTPTKRRWRIPPPLIQDGQGPGPEGLSILDEFQGEMGVVLWKTWRGVILWSETDAGSRRNLFDEGATERRQLEILAAVPADREGLRDALEDLLPLLSKPQSVDGEFVGIACSRIASWAEGQNAPRTSLEFLQAAALACPANAGFALAVGGKARDLTHYARAEAWFYRAVGLARQTNEWEVYVRSYLNHGIMMFRRGALPAARRSFLKALRRSRRQGLREGEAKALHDLFTLEHRAADGDRAMRYASEAITAYGPDHDGLPRLAHDIAYAWLERGDCRHSLPVFMETLGRVGPAERPVVLGSLARSAAGAGDVGAYEWARRHLEEFGPVSGAAESWVDMARAALTLDRYDEAEEAAGLAESIARTRREGQMRFLAEAVLERIREEEAAAKEPVEAAAESAAVSDELARRLIRSLQQVPIPAGVA